MAASPLPAQSARAVVSTLMRDGGFCRLWLCGALTGVLRWLELLVVAVFTLQATGSALMVSLLTCARMAPLIVFGMVIGALADRFDRKTLLLLGLASLVLAALAQAALAWHGQLTLWHVALGALLSGLLWSAEFPVRRTLLGEIAGHGRLGQAMALDSATSNATRMVGPALGGLVLDRLGIEGAMLLAALLYGLAFVIVWPLAAPARSAAGALRLLDTLREGWQAVRLRPLIMATLAVTLIVNLWGFAYITMVPVIGERQLGLDPVLIGVLASTEGLGALIGALLVGAFARPAAYTRIYFYASLVFLLAVIAFGLSTSLALSFVLMLLCGIAISGFAVMQGTLSFLAAPAAVRARVMGLVTVTIGGAPLGMLHVGLLADWLGGGPAVVVMAAEGVIALLLAGLAWPELRRAVRWEEERG
jgi:MFS family permease